MGDTLKDNEKKSKNKIVADLNNSPSEENWKKFAIASKKDGSKYYRIFFPTGKIKGKSDLTGAYAVIYDSKYRSLYSIPIIVKRNKEIEGATIYLTHLELNRKVK